MIAIILAGGQGTRLWPMSRHLKPKQFYPILSDKPLIVDVYNRLRKSFDINDIYISTVSNFVDQIAELLPEIASDHFCIEPARKDSGPAMALMASFLAKHNRGNEPFVFVPTDHYIADEDLFLQTLKVGGELVSQTGKLVDICVAPQYPSTALGYTKIGKAIETRENIEVFSFLGHTEKPEKSVAIKYLQSGDYLWHANYYMWTAEKMLEAYKKYAPEIYNNLKSYENMPKISIDYAITEKLDPEQVLILRGDFGWSDIGTWDIIHDQHEGNHDEFGNYAKGKVVHFDSHNCLFYSDHDKLITAFGVQDLIIVQTEDALLVCPKSRAQEVKKLVEEHLTDHK